MTAVRHYRRVVVSIASGSAGPGGLKTAADIARLFEAELAGLYIEDESVFGATELPFFAEIALAGTPRMLRRGDLERAYQAAARSIRRQFEAAATAARISFSFNALRGNIADLLERGAGPEDIVVFVEPEAALERVCIGTADLFAAALKSRGALLYLPSARGDHWAGVAAVLGGPADRTVLEAAARIAATRAGRLLVVTPAPDPHARKTVDAVLAATGGGVADVEQRVIEAGSLEALLARASELDDRLVVVAREAGALADPRGLWALIRRRRAPLLIIEPETEEA